MSTLPSTYNKETVKHEVEEDYSRRELTAWSTLTRSSLILFGNGITCQETLQPLGRVSGKSNYLTHAILQDDQVVYSFSLFLTNSFGTLLFLPIITSPAGPITFSYDPGPLPRRRRRRRRRRGGYIGSVRTSLDKMSIALLFVCTDITCGVQSTKKWWTYDPVYDGQR